MLAKLKAYDPRRGLLMQNYMYAGTVYQAGSWYSVDDGTAEYLADVHEDPSSDESPLAFVIARDERHAIKLDDEEKRRAEERSRRQAGEGVRASGRGRVDLEDARRRIAAEDAAAAAGVVTSRDLPPVHDVDQDDASEGDEAGDDALFDDIGSASTRYVGGDPDAAIEGGVADRVALRNDGTDDAEPADVPGTRQAAVPGAPVPGAPAGTPVVSNRRGRAARTLR